MEEKYRLILAAVFHLMAKPHAFDLVMLAEELKRRGTFEMAGGAALLAELWDAGKE